MLKDSFCSSPWFHIKIDPNGNFIPCRWDFSFTISDYNIKNTSLTGYLNSDIMQTLRTQILNGKNPKTCRSCRYEDQLEKVSGRQRQLLKSAINLQNFDKSFCASPHYDLFKYSYDNQGRTNNQPVDLQIDLGNTCNSACIMCTPTYSSRLETDYDKLNILEPILFPKSKKSNNWSDDPTLLNKFVTELGDIPNVRYLHFLGGETLYLKSFYDICNRLIDNGSAKNINIGTTTNCTIYTPELERIIQKFNHVHLGLSIESFHFVNDYIRWPASIDHVWDNIEYFLELRKRTDLHLSLRITPSILSIYHIDTIFKFMLDNHIIAESCNILQNPSCLRIELLPKNIANQILDKINKLIDTYKLLENSEVIVNRRREDLIDSVIKNVIFEYKHLLENYQAPENVEEERHNLINFIKSFESLRNNKILNYLPEYEEFLRRYGY